MDLNHTHGLEMIEMGEFDSLKPTLIKLLSVTELLLIIDASSSHSSPKLDTKVPCFVQPAAVCVQRLLLWISRSGLFPPLPPQAQNLPAYLQR